MAGSKPKQFTRPPPKKKAKATPVTADDFQEAADFEEAAGGKHRVGDPVKSGRAFLRALELYDNGLSKHPSSLDLAYNKARLQLEISQQPALVEHIGTPLVDWLQLTLESHRHALRLSEDNPDALFNTAQVLTSLAEELSEDDRSQEAAKPLQEALELLSSCLSRQEMMFEQHRLDFPDTEEGGVPVDANAEQQSAPAPASAPSADTDMAEQSANIETPVSASDLLDTVHASLSALTTLLPLVDESAFQNLGEMAHSLTENKAPAYLALLPNEEQDSARLSVALDRAVFVAAYANAQFEAQLIELNTYIERLSAFDVPGKDSDAGMLCADADARIELVLSAIDRFGESSGLPAMVCWKQLGISQDLYSKASKLTTEEAQDRKAEVYKSKGDLELLRHRIATIQKADLSDVVLKSAKTLIANAQTFYKGAVQLAKQADDEDVEEAAEQRGLIAREIAALLYGGPPPSERNEAVDADLMEILEGCVDEGLVSQSLAGAIMQNDGASHS